MDALAGDTCYKYVNTDQFFKSNNNFILVTASVDHIDFLSNL